MPPSSLTALTAGKRGYERHLCAIKLTLQPRLARDQGKEYEFRERFSLGESRRTRLHVG